MPSSPNTYSHRTLYYVQMLVRSTHIEHELSNGLRGQTNCHEHFNCLIITVNC